MKNFICYARSRFGEFVILLSWCAVFAVSFALCHVDIRAVIYPAFLCVLIWLARFFVLFGSEKSKQSRIRNAANMSGSDVVNFLPEYRGLAEREYQNVIGRMTEYIAEKNDEHEKSFGEMTEYFTTWAHQIKTPIASLYLKLDTLEDSRSIRSDVFRIEQYTDMVLTYLRMGADDYVIRRCDVDIIVKKALKRFAGEFILRRISLDYDGVSISTVTDEKWLQFVIEQVLSNALKYTKSGSISVYNEESGVLCIRDTGIGIAPEDIPMIFERGYTGKNGRLDRRSSGIGLYLCNRIMKNLNHGISIESEVGAGTTVKLDLSREDRAYD